MPMPLPFKRIKVVSTDYKVELLPQEECETYSVAGTCHQTPQDPRIRVAKHKEPTALADTVLHEVMHAILRQQGRYYCKAEEEYVTALANGVITVLDDNPKLRKYLRAN